MKNQTLPLISIAAGAGLLMQVGQAAVSPYQGSEANTVYLFNFNETTGSSAVNSASGAAALSFDALTVDGNPLTAGLATNITGLFGATAFPGFGTAVNLSGGADLGIPLDVTGPGGTPDGVFVASGSPNADDITLSSIMGTDSAFTFEALINIPNLTIPDRSIVQTDNSSANALRGFQFRINNGNVEVNSIGSFSNNGTAATLFPIPTTGPNAFVANEWFHVAMVYSNAGGSETTTVYWTRVNATTETASVLGTTTNEGVDPAWIAPLVIGNEGRNTGSGANMVGGLRGLIDEVRISNVARGPGDFIFTSNSDSDGDDLLDSWELTYFRESESETVTEILAKQGRNDDFDFDGASNIAEQTAGSDPSDAESVPGDIDGDGLSDAWELTYFADLADEDGFGDPDLDYATNEEEETALTDPTQFLDYPDSEGGTGDGLSDGWEMFYFFNLNELPTGDPDGDLYTNEEEFQMNTDPTDPLSSDDEDVDGLNDGWEAIHFANPGESRATVLAKQSGSGDADGDGYTNEQEETAGTLPTGPQKPSDSDGDGLIDSWETFHFGDLAPLPADLTGDSDSFTLLQEQNAGSNPTSAASVPGDIDGDGLADTLEAFQPYTADSETLHLWHLDEIDQPAADAGSSPLTLGAVNANGRLWAPSLAGFGTGFDPSTGRGTTTGGVLSAKTLGGGVGDDATFTYMGADGAFTIDAIVRLDFDPTVAPASVSSMQIVSAENDLAQGAARVWQFRLVPIGGPGNAAGTAPLLEFINLRGEVGVQSISAPLPSGTDPDAPAQGSWYHVAVAYDGNEATAGNLKLYWTKMDPARTEARELLSAQMTQDLIDSPADFTIGNEGRDNGGSSDSFLGVIDEVRISSVARAASGFHFVSTEVADGLDDAWELTYFGDLDETDSGDFDGDGTDNLTEFRLGLIPNDGSSRFAATSGTAGALTWPSVTGVTFTIERSPSLASGSWTVLEAAFAGTAGTATYTDPAPPTGRAFYRIRLNP
jgi:hypothetical protein